MEFRIEHDSMGEDKSSMQINIGLHRQNAVIKNFKIGMGLEDNAREIIHAFGLLKKSCSNGKSYAEAGKNDGRKTAGHFFGLQ